VRNGRTIRLCENVVDFRRIWAKISYMSQADIIIDKLGGTRKAATILGLPPSTVQSWKVAGFIPAKHQATVLEKAVAAGISLTADDFFPAIGAASSNERPPCSR
jgi:hypothetical protein